MDQYESDYQAIKETVQTKPLPDLFCQLERQLGQLPPEVQSQEIQEQVQSVFVDVNTEIEKYNEQFQYLIKELGILCRQESKDLVQRFFQALLDLFRLASSIYQTTPEKLAPFGHLLHELRVGVDTGTWKLEGDAFQKALLLQLVKSAWVLTRTETDMNLFSKKLQKQSGGKNRTRKLKR